jgi:hypothetical protein
MWLMPSGEPVEEVEAEVSELTVNEDGELIIKDEEEVGPEETILKKKAAPKKKPALKKRKRKEDRARII